MTITPITSAAARDLLVASELPVDDLDDPAITLLGAFDGASLVGVVGLQRCGEHALLRSLAVVPAQRARGLGRLLCNHVEVLARAGSATELYLLTTAAADYFARLGYEPVERDGAPDAIRATAQFASLCPSSARVLRRQLPPIAIA
jgi:amino-acid N-acetyltransferase